MEKTKEKELTENIEVVKKTKVAIVGFAGTRDQAPFNNPEFEIWSVNNLHNFIPRTDRVFQLHQRCEWEVDDLHGFPGKKHLEWLQTCGVPVYTIDKCDDIPTSIKYPLDKMIEEFGIPRLKSKQKDAYFTNSISFMIALAIHEGFKEIHVYGVDMAVLSEYNDQRPSCEYYLGIAKGKGIDVYLPTESDLLKTRFIYGYEEEEQKAWKIKVSKVLEQMQNHKLQSDNMIRNQQSVSDKYEGAISAIVEMDKTWG